ncbi:prepilin-type N-terminal cleavage/methylation domain-containing protein [Pigmentibacter sp. JX0631]|uniref:type IV pilus modification PilV family protein n=1 Tax=Pigmentibacter sp. JX0631 TaxID=2976982 RepID=UPI00246845FE|nr:prepilin-type N-terminal cleavage/methylation domain-containing protein [Pigmentibacter sp. JX0631]WGL59289.1 prepilin-type N-terminal cleavage/methylation domain-containing protein [Pigmentibacter sp. JX0631]
MQIFRYLKDNYLLKDKLNKMQETDGFTLFECILAIAILSVTVASIVGLQSSIISVTQIASDGMKGSWAARSAIAQMQYIVETQGQDKLPEEKNYPWITDSQFSISLKRKELKDVKISQFLTSAIGIYNIVNPQGNENQDVDRMLASITSVLDGTSGSSPKGFFSNFLIEVKWTSGIVNKTINEGFFFVDKNTFANINLPDPPGSNNNNNNNQNNNGNNGNNQNNNGNNNNTGNR